VLIQIPFMNSTLYVGPVADWLGGAELAWVLGLVVAGGLYYAFSSDIRRRQARSRVPMTVRR
jgi:NCS1 family nucleobase:cation symporter-1